MESQSIKKVHSNRREFLPYIHSLRGLAILFIVGIHCRTSFPWKDKGVELLFESFLDNGTIIFVFISGFLFEHLFTHNFNFKKYLNKKLKFVIIPYLLVSIVPIIDKLYFEDSLRWLPPVLNNQPDLIKGFYMLVTGKHFGPYWFIPMIVIFYLISPLLVVLNNARFYKYIFPLVFIAGLFTYKFGYYSNTWDSFLYFLPIYLFGMFSSYYKDDIIAQSKWLLYTCVIIYLIVTTLELTGHLEIHKLIGFEPNTQPDYLFNFTKFKVSLLCIALLLIFYNIRYRKMSILKVLGDYSFGIYFIHLYFIVATQFVVNSQIEAFRMTTPLFLVYTVLVTIVCVAIIYIIKKIFGNKSRYLIGS